MKLSIIMPCWKRPQRTERAIESVINQSNPNWELLVVGDHCENVRKLQHHPIYSQHPQIRIYDMPEHEGKYGTQCLNWGIDNATGGYVSFLGNDDYILPGYVQNRLESIEKTRAEVIYHNALIQIQPGQYQLRFSRPAFGHVGGSELVVQTELARQVKFTSTEYGHDWTFLTELAALGARIGAWNAADYVVTHIPNQVSEQGID